MTDLGTEFGVEVGKDSSDVCVFAGSVEVATRSGNGKVASRILLTANGQRSARTQVGDAAVTPIAVSPEAFVRVEKFKAIVEHRPQRVWIGNASFDDPKLEPGAGVFQYGAPGIWTVERFGDANFGVHRLSNGGPQFFFWNEPYGSLRQRYLFHRVEAAGMAYTLRFRVGTRNVGKCSVTARLLLNGEPPKERSLRLELQTPTGGSECRRVRRRRVRLRHHAFGRGKAGWHSIRLHHHQAARSGCSWRRAAYRGSSGRYAWDNGAPDQGRRRVIWEDTASPPFGPAALRAGEIRASIPGSRMESDD